jgi:bifunctional non-homologous end joining protein LigD
LGKKLLIFTSQMVETTTRGERNMSSKPVFISKKEVRTRFTTRTWRRRTADMSSTSAYGRRGGSMTTGSKTSSPVDLDEALKVWRKLVDSKLAKGYRHMTAEGPSVIPQAELPDTPTEIQCVLLNPVDEDECERLLDDDEWIAQPKFDGVRFMLGRKDGKVYALNRKGKSVSVPTNIAVAAVELERDFIISRGDFLIDGELVGETLHAFDVLELEGKCLRGIPVERRLSFLSDFSHKSICVAPNALGEEKRKLHRKLKKEGGEGIVFKRLGSKYSVGRPASGGNYLKFKFYSTASCVVSNVNQKRSVSLEMACGTPVGNVTIPVNYEVPKKGDIVEVRYLYAYKGGSLYQPTYLGLRDDVDADTLDSLKLKNEEDS